MRIYKISYLLFAAILLTSCDTNSKKSSDETTSTNETVDTSNSDIINNLQGSWKRQTYPFGSIEFKGNNIKFVTGEGAAEAPKFQDFKITNTCPFEGDYEASGKFIVLDNSEVCNKIKINGDTFVISYSPKGGKVTYKKE